MAVHRRFSRVRHSPTLGAARFLHSDTGGRRNEPQHRTQMGLVRARVVPALRVDVRMSCALAVRAVWVVGVRWRRLLPGLLHR